MEEKLEAYDLGEWSERFSNRGRWGDDDRYGTLNFITRERVLDACALARTGQIVSCALPLGENGLPRDAPARENPAHARSEASARGCDANRADENIPSPPQSCTQWGSRLRIVDDGKTLVGVYGGYAGGFPHNVPVGSRVQTALVVLLNVGAQHIGHAVSLYATQVRAD